MKYAVHGYSKTFHSRDEAIKFAESVSVSRSRVLMICPPGLLQKNFDRGKLVAEKQDDSYWLDRGIKQEKKLMTLRNKSNKR